ncbi:MAG: ribose-phosphate pyrophosphokinase, partial [Spirochaetota bacterium]
MRESITIFSGTSNEPLTQAICNYLRMPLSQLTAKKFSDGELSIKVNENVRGKDVFIVQSISNPANDHIMELLLILDALRRASARRITAVIPYYGYGRQDRKVEPRVPISARVVADIIERLGPSRILTMDLHADQIQGFFNIPVDHLFFSGVLVEYIKEKQLQDLVIVSPDSGGAERARYLAKKVNAKLAIIDKRRPAPNVSEVMHIIGDVAGKNCLILDDMIDTAGTICKAAQALLKHGAKTVMCCATHGVLSGDATNRLNQVDFSEVVLADTIRLSSTDKIENLKLLSVAPVFAQAIERIHHEESVSALFV